MNDIEQQLRTTFAEIAAHDTPTPDLAERLIANARSGTNTVVPLRRSMRFTAPLLAAAVVLLLVAGILVATRFTANTPPVSPPPAPAPSGPSVSATGSAPTSGGIAGGLSVPSWVTGTVSGSAGLPAGFTPRSTQFLDRTTGFLLGSGPCSTGSEQCGGLYRTEDGGATWTEVTALAAAAGGNSGGVSCPIGDPEADTCVLTVQFSDAQHGVAWGGMTVFSTVDAGTSWQRITGARSDIRTVALLGDVVYGLEFDESTSTARLVRGVGSAFAEVDGSGQAPDPQNLTVAGNRLFVLSTSLTDGVITLASTTDGTTWRTEPAPPCSSQELVGRADGSVALSCLFSPGEPIGGALLTEGARSWTTLQGSPVPVVGTSALAQVVAITDALHFVVLVDRGGVTGGSRYAWGATSDGGATWTTVSSDTAFPSPADPARPLSENNGTLSAVLSSQRLLLTSTDLGLTWNARALG